MSIFFEAPGVVLHHGDCIDVMRTLPDSSVHAVVTDPPYGLEFMGKQWDSFGRGEAVSEAAAGPMKTGYTDGAKRIERPSFLGGVNPKCVACGKWQRGGNPCRCEAPDFTDERGPRLRAFQDWCEEWAREAFRVLKPGGYLLAFGGSRTWHRLQSGIEDAGFEIRDSIAWLYGSGFPKSMNVAAAIDKVRDDVADVRVVCRWLRDRIDEHPTASIRSIAESFGFHARMVEHWAARDSDSQPTLPTLAQWDALRIALAFSDELDAEVYRLNMRKGEPGEAWADREVVGTVTEWENRTNYALTSRDGLKRGLTKNPDAEAWEGWGTALKPAFEPIVVARKPLIGTVARNVLEHGTGALNIDATRTATNDSLGGGQTSGAVKLTHEGWNRPWMDDAEAVEASAARARAAVEKAESMGRWPTNVVLDESQAAELDKQTGILTSGANPTRRGADGDRTAYGEFKGQADANPQRGTDSGGASRFFPTFRYEAKAPGSERPDVDGVMHPTVKPLDLMRWLVRLVTPKDGTILEPFAGSGTTLEAALLEGFNVIGIEREADYLPLIEARLTKPLQPAMFGDWEA